MTAPTSNTPPPAAGQVTAPAAPAKRSFASRFSAAAAVQGQGLRSRFSAAAAAQGQRPGVGAPASSITQAQTPVAQGQASPTAGIFMQPAVPVNATPRPPVTPPVQPVSPTQVISPIATIPVTVQPVVIAPAQPVSPVSPSQVPAPAPTSPTTPVAVVHVAPAADDAIPAPPPFDAPPFDAPALEPVAVTPSPVPGQAATSAAPRRPAGVPARPAPVVDLLSQIRASGGRPSELGAARGSFAGPVARRPAPIATAPALPGQAAEQAGRTSPGSPALTVEDPLANVPDRLRGGILAILARRAQVAGDDDDVQENEFDDDSPTNAPRVGSVSGSAPVQRPAAETPAVARTTIPAAVPVATPAVARPTIPAAVPVAAQPAAQVRPAATVRIAPTVSVTPTPLPPIIQGRPTPERERQNPAPAASGEPRVDSGSDTVTPPAAAATQNPAQRFREEMQQRMLQRVQGPAATGRRAGAATLGRPLRPVAPRAAISATLRPAAAPSGPATEPASENARGLRDQFIGTIPGGASAAEREQLTKIANAASLLATPVREGSEISADNLQAIVRFEAMLRHADIGPRVLMSLRDNYAREFPGDFNLALPQELATKISGNATALAFETQTFSGFQENMIIRFQNKYYFTAAAIKLAQKQQGALSAQVLVSGAQATIVPVPAAPQSAPAITISPSAPTPAPAQAVAVPAVVSVATPVVSPVMPAAPARVSPVAIVTAPAVAVPAMVVSAAPSVPVVTNPTRAATPPQTVATLSPALTVPANIRELPLQEQERMLRQTLTNLQQEVARLEASSDAKDQVIAAITDETQTLEEQNAVLQARVGHGQPAAQMGLGEDSELDAEAQLALALQMSSVPRG